MNTKKHKHKNRPKPNAGSAEVKDGQKKSDVSEKKHEEIPKPEQITPEAVPSLIEAVKEEEIKKVPVQIQENVVPSESITEPGDDKDESPAKPKRNKNKKKKQEPETPTPVEKVEPIKEQVPEEVIKLEDPTPIDVGKIEPDKESEEAFTPSARKKKNKKKTQEIAAETNPTEEIKPTAQKEELEQVKEEPLSVDVTELFTSTSEPVQDSKGKKKNKKKKRNDSERSDKSEDVKCTAAFDKLLAEDTKPQETETKDAKITVSKTMEEALPVQSTEKEITDEIKQDIKAEEVTELQKDANKGKKKNKKDKKNILLEPPQQPSVEALPEKIETPSQLEETFITTETKIEKEHSPKPKAKIAKPVEKKRKDNIEITPSENISKSSENIDILLDTNIPTTDPTNTPKEEIQTELEKKPNVNIETPDSAVKEESNLTAVEEKLKVPENSAMGKKRKKSPKPKPSKIETLVEDIKIPSDVSITAPPSVNVEIIKPDLNLEDVTETHTKDSQQIKEIKEKTPDVMKSSIDDDLPPLTPITDDKSHEGKGKKKKKIPKTPIQSDLPKTIQVENTSESIKETNSKEQTEKSFAETSKSSTLKDTSSKTKNKESDTELSKQLLEDIEVRSVRTDESEGSVCDVTPDVHFVRSSSQQILDTNNNNMVIQEIVSSEELRSNEPIAMPWIQGSGETPTPTHKVKSPTFEKKKGKDKNVNKDESTDVKSKIMEVNKDMEELRLSIERSLAEFSAMEKTELESGKKFEETGSKGMKPPPELIPEIKQDAPQIQEIPFKEESKILEQEFQPEEKCSDTPPCPARKDKKGKSKKKGKLETPIPTATTSSTSSSEATAEASKTTTEQTKEEKQENSQGKSQSSESKGKQQSDKIDTEEDSQKKKTDKDSNETNLIRKESAFSDSLEKLDFDPIDNFEDALTSSMDDVNRTFEMIAQDAENENDKKQKELGANKPEINVTAAEEETTRSNKDEKINPVSQPKNLLGHTDIPVPSNRTDYKKEKNKAPNERQAKVKIKDATDVEKKSKESQTESRIKNIEKSVKDTFSHVVKDNDDYVYKYSFRKVFLQSSCHVCKKDLGQMRVPCGYCNLVFYCGAKHKDDDYPQHQALCFAVSTIVHLKDQKHIYADARGISGQDYRILRMQMILSCEKVLKRRLVPWEQEAMLYPRICADVSCREWHQGKLKDCEGCGQLSYCANEPDHLPKSHQRWCKSYSLYAKLVTYQQTKGRLEPRLPTKVFTKYQIPGKMNEVLAAIYEEKIDMNDIQYAALTQLATAPLTAAYYHQVYREKKLSQMRNCNGTFKKPFIIHVVGAELQFEADALNKWEIFFLHLRPDVDEMTVVLVSPALNPGNLPLDLLGKVRMCAECKASDRRVTFSFQDKTYFEYRTSEVFINPDLICAFNPSIQRGSSCNLKEEWSSTITSILKLKLPFIITAYTLPELRKDIAKLKELTELNFNIITEPVFNNFASVRPDRNFITDDEIPLLFKNYCVSVICGC